MSIDNDTRIDCHGQQHTLVPFISPSRLEYVHIAVAEFFMRGENIESIIHPRLGHDDRLAEVVTGIDLEDLVAGLAACGASLRFIVLTLTMRGQSVWAIERVGEERVLNRLDDHAGRCVIEREEQL